MCKIVSDRLRRKFGFFAYCATIVTEFSAAKTILALCVFAIFKSSQLFGVPGVDDGALGGDSNSADSERCD